MAKEKRVLTLNPLSILAMERVMGIEPTLSAWEADALPLSYTRLFPTILIASAGIVKHFF